jgi:hypothetical protein
MSLGVRLNRVRCQNAQTWFYLKNRYTGTLQSVTFFLFGMLQVEDVAENKKIGQKALACVPLS